MKFSEFLEEQNGINEESSMNDLVKKVEKLKKKLDDAVKRARLNNTNKGDQSLMKMIHAIESEEYLDDEDYLEESTQFLGRNKYPLVVKALGKSFVVRGIFLKASEANAFMEKNPKTGVIDEYKMGGKTFIVVANFDKE